MAGVALMIYPGVIGHWVGLLFAPIPLAPGVMWMNAPPLEVP